VWGVHIVYLDFKVIHDTKVHEELVFHTSPNVGYDVAEHIECGTMVLGKRL
jgi:hypothetical protein